MAETLYAGTGDACSIRRQQVKRLELGGLDSRAVMDCRNGREVVVNRNWKMAETLYAEYRNVGKTKKQQ